MGAAVISAETYDRMLEAYCKSIIINWESLSDHDREYLIAVARRYFADKVEALCRTN